MKLTLRTMIAPSILAALSAAPVICLAEGPQSQLKTVKYSKEELAAAANPSFIGATDLSHVLVAKFKLIVTTVTQRQAGSNVKVRDVAGEVRQPTKQDHMRKLGTLAYDPESEQARGDTDKLRMTMSHQYRKATEVKFKEAFPFFENLKKGVSFKMNLANPTSLIPKKSTTPEIRYGLVEADIVPAESSIAIASRGSDDELRYASPAKVVYTIDKLETNDSRQVFTTSAPVDENAFIGETQNTSVWRKVPSANVNVKIDAADQEATVSDQVGQGAMPNARVTLTQVDGLVSTQFLAGGKVNKDSMVTEVKLPVYGEMSVARKYNSKLKSTHSSALNLLGDAKLPRVNVHYAHAEKKYKGEWIVKKDRFEYNVTAEPRQSWGGEDSSFGKVGDRVSFGIQSNF